MDINYATEILKDVSYPNYTIYAKVDGRREMYLQAKYNELDIITKDMSIQMTRRWFISPEMTKSELVQTAFKCILTSMEHRVREHFKYKKYRVYGPHYDVEKLVELCASRQATEFRT